MRTAFLAVITLALACSCAKKESSKETGSSEPAFTATGRGEVKHIAVGPKATVLTIHHEAIPDWLDRSGKKMSMMSMSMEFRAGPSLDVGGVAAGDKVEFGIAVYYGADDPRMEITSIKKLPPDTALELSGP